MSSNPVWATQRFPDQPGLHRITLSINKKVPKDRRISPKGDITSQGERTSTGRWLTHHRGFRPMGPLSPFVSQPAA